MLLSLLGNRLKEERLKARLTQEALAKAAGCSQVEISRLEKAKMGVSLPGLKKIACALGKPLNYFLEDPSVLKPDEPLQSIFKAQSRLTHTLEATVQIPVLGEVPAGGPELLEELIEDYIEFPGGWLQGANYALKVRGLSMEPLILPGDLVLVRQQENFNDGEVVIALVEGETTLKRIFKTKKETVLKDGKDQTFYRGKGVKVMGKVVKVVRDV